MGNFKDYIASDLDVTFINPTEFADLHTIDNRQLNIIVDKDRLMERSKKEYDGISVGEILYFVLASDYGKKPEQGMPQTFDGRLMYVFDVREDEGIYEIILQQNRSE